MKKRVFSLFLALSFLLSVVTPLIGAAEGTGSEVYPEIDESEYNKLYVQDGLFFAADFFRLNEHWGGTLPEMPTLPITWDNYEYKKKISIFYDANGDGVEQPTEIYYLVDVFTDANANGERDDGEVIRAVECFGDANANGERDEDEGTYIAIESWTDTNEDGVRNKDEATYEPIPLIEGEEGEEPTEPWTEATYATTSTFVDLTKLENRVVTQNGIAKGWTPEFSAAISNYQMQFRLLFSSFTYVAKTRIDEEGDPFNSYLTIGVASFGTKDYQDQTGEKQKATFTLKNGFVRVGHQTANCMLRVSNIPYEGLITADLVVAQPTALDHHIFTLRDSALYMTASSNAVLFKQIRDYGNGGTSSYTLPGATLLVPQGKPFPLTIQQNRTADYDAGTAALLTSAWSNNLEIAKDIPTNDKNTGLGGACIVGNYATANIETDFYAFRFYDRALTAAERRQNHMADLCKYFRIDISEMTRLSENEIAFIAQGEIQDLTFTSTREEIAAAIKERLDFLLDGSFHGEGEARDAFRAAVVAGEIDANEVRALPAANQAEVYAALAALAEGATAEEKQAAVDAAVDAILQRDYANYPEREPVLSAAAFFEGKTLSTAAERFRAIAMNVDADLSALVGVDEVILEHLYESFADVDAELPSLQPIVQKRLDETLADYKVRYLGEALADDLLAFVGYQMTTTGALGARALYTVDTAILRRLEEAGYTVNFGALFHTLGNAAALGVTKENGTYVPKVSGSQMAAAYKTGLGYLADPNLYGGTYGGAPCFAYERMTENAAERLIFSAYVVLERAGQEDTFYYETPDHKTFQTTPTLKNFATHYKNKLGVAFPNMQKILTSGKDTVTKTSLYLGGANLTEYRVVIEDAHEDMATKYIAAIKAVTNVTVRSLNAADVPEGDTMLIRFVKGTENVFTRAADGSIVFTYNGTATAGAAALSAAFATPDLFEEEGRTQKIAICFLKAGEALSASTEK